MFEDLKVVDDPRIKIAACKSCGYNMIFRKITPAGDPFGELIRWGKTWDEDPQLSPGPEIADIEISSGNCSSNCYFCLPKGTRIKTIVGDIPIEKVKENDLIIGYDTERKSYRIQQVREVYKRQFSGELIQITLENGEILEITPNHEVFLSNGRIIPAGELQEEDDVIGW